MNCICQEHQKYFKIKDQKHKNTKTKQKGLLYFVKKVVMLYEQFYGLIKYVWQPEFLPINVSLAYFSMEIFSNRPFLS